MPAAITTLRSTIAAALANPGVWTVFNYPPATMQSSSIVVAPADPYITPSNNSRAAIAPLANFKILMTTPAFDNQGNLAGMEDFILAVVTKLAASSLTLNISTISAPAIVNAASGDLLVSEITVSILTEWS